MMKPLTTLSVNKVIWLTTLLAGLVAWRVMFIQHGWINDDSTLYFEMAKRFSIGQWQQGWELFTWPFYPFLIAMLHKVTGIDLHLSAQVLAVVFYGLTAWSLSKLIQLAGGNQLTIICGNLLLISSLYITGDVLAMLLRDQGFWAFFLTSLVFFIRFMRHHHWADAVWWQLSIIVATLFRIEAFAYAVLLPLVLLIHGHSWRISLMQFIKVNFIHLLLFTLILIALIASHAFNMTHLGRLNEITGLFSADDGLSVKGMFQTQSEIFSQKVLGGYLEDYAKFGLFITLISIVVIKCFNVVGVVASVLMLCARQHLFKLPQRDAQQVFIMAGAVAMLNASVIIFRSFVLSSRYVIAIGFLVIIFTAFYLSNLIASQQRKSDLLSWQFMLLVVVALLMGAGLIKNLASKSGDYHYEQQAVAWVKTHAPANARIYYDSARLRDYANVAWAGRADHLNSTELITSIRERSEQYDCLLIRAEVDELNKLAQIQSLTQYVELKRFSNKVGNQVLVLCHPNLK
ncbi:MAG: hypothetical protein HOP21_04275 [Methylotenera sp.]|nr:hypothetical protein [Methylotenera sp.]